MRGLTRGRPPSCVVALHYLLLDFRPGILECDCTIEDKSAWSGLHRVNTEVAKPFKLIALARLSIRQARLDLTIGEYLPGPGVDIVLEGLALLHIERIGLGEKMLVEPNLGRNGMGS